MDQGKYNISRITVTAIFVLLLAFPALFTGWRKIVPSNKEREYSNAYGFYLKEISHEIGVDFTHHIPELDSRLSHIQKFVASTGASVSVSDFNNDGWNDFYITNSCFGEPNALYQNLQDGTFRDVADAMGVANLNTPGSGVSQGAVWADYDNDGFEDLFVYQWGRPALFRNDRGLKFIDVTDQSGLPSWVNANTAIWFDYDADGKVDLFIGGYFPENINLWHLKSTRILAESFEYAQNGGRNYLMHNEGNGTFRDVSLESGLTSTRWTLAAGAVDTDMDGFPELIIANDYGNPEFYYNEKGRRFVDRSSTVMIGLSPKSGMNVSFGDAFNRGKMGIYISNITEAGILLQGNNFWIPVGEKGKELYANEAKETGIEMGGWSYGAQFGDLNNDGFTDLYVANGFISGKKGTSYWYDYTKVTGGNASIISDARNWPAIDGRTQSGYQQNRIYMNNGDGFFKDAARVVSDTESFDGRAVAFADLWNRGVLDVLVANQHNRFQVYRNEQDGQRHWAAFRLTGIRNNRSAVGAQVTLYWNGTSQLQVVSGGIGFSSQNQRRVQYGMGTATSADSVVIQWPGGRRQVMVHPPVDTLISITEAP